MLIKKKLFQDLKLKCLEKLVLKMYNLRMLNKIEIDVLNLIVNAYFN